MGLMGMDTEQGAEFARALTRHRERCDELRDDLGRQVAATVDGPWQGPDADDFARLWESEVEQRFIALVEQLRSMTDEFVLHVEEQDRVSDVDGSAPAVASAPAPVCTAPSSGAKGGSDHRAAQAFLGIDLGDVTPEEVGREFLEDIGISPADVATGMVSAPHSMVGHMTEKGLTKAPAFVPYIGDAFVGIEAGAERWSEDAGRTDLSTTDRVGRAVLDGAVNGAGSVLGGTALGGAGAAVGTAAGAVVGPEGAVAGGVIGGVVGDGVGGYLGATMADAAVDSVLD